MNRTVFSKFWYWINERQRIYLKRRAGRKKPWTDDSILQRYSFCNVFREQDRTTIALRKRLSVLTELDEVFWHTCAFRLFNWPATYDWMSEAGLLDDWSLRRARSVLRKMSQTGEKMYTSAYIISSHGRARPKYETIAESLNTIYRDRRKIVDEIEASRSIEKSVKLLSQYPSVAGFVGYELATDFRHTPLLNEATDIMTWANPGPGARRGLNRIHRGSHVNKTRVSNYVDEMRELLEVAPKHLDKRVFRGHVLEMRDIEHSLCEVDKYLRAEEQGGLRRKFDGEP